jgi:hypothetical protein
MNKYLKGDDGNTYDWNTANSNCLRLGGHLASVHSEEENTLIHEVIRKHRANSFIGLYLNDFGKFLPDTFIQIIAHTHRDSMVRIRYRYDFT